MGCLHKVRDLIFKFWKNFVSQKVTISFQYLAENFLEADNNHHWRTSTYQCGPCILKYNIITHIENSAADIAEVIKIMKVEGITHFGTFYSTHEEKLTHWSAVSKEVLRGIYRHYWLDFVLLGYSVEEAQKIINLGKGK